MLVAVGASGGQLVAGDRLERADTDSAAEDRQIGSKTLVKLAVDSDLVAAVPESLPLRSPQRTR
jgi:hypothetical protein